MKTLNNILLLTFISIFALNLTSCSDDKDEETRFSDMNMSTGTKEEIKNGDGLTWRSENDLIASVSGSVVNAIRKGSVMIASDKGSFKVTVTPSHTLFSDPCLEWGSSVDDVKSFMEGYSLYGEADEGLFYNGNGAVGYIGYIFKNAKLESAGVYVKTVYMEDLVEHLNERYVHFGEEENEAFYFISPDKNMLVILTAQKLGNSYYYLVMFTKAESSSTAKDIMTKSMKPAFGSVIKNNESTKQEDCQRLMQKLEQKIVIE